MIPTYEQIEDPLLRLTATTSSIALRDAVSHIADHFDMTHDERASTLPNTRRNYVYDRTAWAATYMVKAGLLSRPKRGVLAITERGREVLIELGDQPVNNDVLKGFDEFREFQSRQQPASSATSPATATTDSSETPDARIASAVQELNDALAEQLLERVRAMDATLFEHLVVDLLVRMGYGGSREDAGSVIGGSGDGGIDGIIKEDRLGLDNIYVQAKRWKEGNTVTRPDVQQFMGALVGRGARKGIFITASTFSSGCREYVRDKDVSIVLIDGDELVELMIEHGVGVEVRDTVAIKDLDDNYFDEA